MQFNLLRQITEVLNLPRYCPRCGEPLHSDSPSTTKGEVRKTARRAYEPKPKAKPKRKASAYSKRYGKAFKKLAPKYKKKNGQWKKDGFKRCGAAARKVAKK